MMIFYKRSINYVDGNNMKNNNIKLKFRKINVHFNSYMYKE